MTETERPAAASWTRETAIERALNYNRDQEEWCPEFEALIAAGSPKVFAFVESPGLGYNVHISAYMGIELGDGTNAAACEPVAITFRRKRGMTNEKAAQWWARKHFGAAFEIKITKGI